MTAAPARDWWRGVVIAVPYAWLLLFFLVPFLYVFKISLADPLLAQPPYTPLFGEEGLYLTLDNYRFLFEDDLYLKSYLKSVQVAAISTLLCLLIGYPMAWAIVRAPRRLRTPLLLLIILPFWSSFLLRVYAWMGILGSHGILNSLLMGAGLIDRPLQILYTDFALYLGIVYSYLPFMILPLYATLERLDPALRDAAADLGARPFTVFVDVILPLSMPGVIAGSLLVFIPAVGEFVIPALLGGPDSLMIGRTLYDEFFFNRDWPLSAAIATVLLLILVAPVMVFQHLHARGQEAPPA